MKKCVFAIMMISVMAVSTVLPVSSVSAMADTQEAEEEREPFSAEIVDGLEVVTPYYSIELPVYWLDKYAIETVDNSTGMWLKLRYKKNGYAAGHLFSIYLTDWEDYTKIAAYDLIGELEDEAGHSYHVIAVYPTDVQYDLEDRDRYKALSGDAETVLRTIEAADGYLYVPYIETLGPDPEEAGGRVIESGDYRCQVNPDGASVTVTEYTGDEDIVEIPSEIEGYPVTDIGYQAFTYKKMKRLTLPDSVRTIGERAFEYCVIEEELVLPGHAAIKQSAFAYAELPAVVTIPEGVTAEDSSFGYCKEMKRLIAGPDVRIGSRAFGYCYDLEQVVCAEGGLLEAHAFEYCKNLKEVFLCGDVDVEEDVFYDCVKMQLEHADRGEFEAKAAGFETNPDGGSGKVPGEEPKECTETEPGRKRGTAEDQEHRITLTGDKDVFTDCPDSAKAGETVTVHTIGVADGEVVIEVNGKDIGKWLEWGTYVFIMPDEDVEIHGLISTEGYPGA